MKKILRLVTTSVLTLTLVACGEASSSVSSSVSSGQTSSVSSATSAYANVSTITLSAASDSLTQTLGTQSRVVVSAALNANTNPNLALEWFVNGTKSNQTGRVFEYTPTVAGTFEIQAKVGTVLSNKLTVEVGLPEFKVESAKFLDNNTIEVKAPGGADITVESNTVEDSSYYSIKDGVYVIDLKTAIKQGEAAVLTLNRAGSQPITQSVVFDTRTLGINTLLTGGTNVEIKLNDDDVYEIKRPHILDRTDGDEANVLNNDVVQYTFTFKSENISGTTAYKLERLLAPSGADAFTTFEGLDTIENIDTSAGLTFSFDVDAETPVGTYEYRYTLGGKVLNFSVEIVAPVAGAEFEQYTHNNADGDATKYDVQFREVINNYDSAIDPAYSKGIELETEGYYEIVKPYLKGATYYNEFQFELDLDNFDVPEEVRKTGTVNSNQMLFQISGPNGAATLLTQAGNTQNALPTPVTFRVNADNKIVTQKVDHFTPVGLYTYSLVVLQLGTEIYRKEVKINIFEHEKSLVETVTQNDPPAGAAVVTLEKGDDGFYEIQKPRSTTGSAFDTQTVKMSFVMTNYESPLNPAATGALSFTSTATAGGRKELLKFNKSVSGPMSIVDAANNADTYVAVELNTDSTTTNLGTIADNDSTTTDTYTYYEDDGTPRNAIDLVDQFVFGVNFLTAPGEYTFTIKVGILERIVKVRVVNPVKKVDLVVDTGAGENFKLNKDDGKYYATLPASGNVTAKFSLLLKNMSANSDGNVAYTFSTAFPDDITDSKTNVAAAVADTGNDGHLFSSTLLSLFGTIDATTGATPSNLDDFAPYVTNKAGEHVFELTVDGVTTKVTLVVQKYPSLTVDSAKIGTASLVKFDGAYLYASANTTKEFTFLVKGVTLGTGNVYYKTAEGALGLTTALDGTAETEKELAAEVAIGLTLLSFEDDLAEVNHETTGRNPTAGTATVVSVFVKLYKFNGTTKVFDFLGHAEIKVADTNIIA